MFLNLFSSLSIEIHDFNSISQNHFLLKEMRRLTLCSNSGMNFELNHLERSSKNRVVKCKIICAFKSKKLVGWALLSKEKTDFAFYNSSYRDKFKPEHGTLFEIFIDPACRRQGIASKIFKCALRKTNGPLCISPWDNASSSFYDKFRDSKIRII